MNTKAIIRFGEIAIDLEGSEAFVATQLDRFAAPLLQGVKDAQPPPIDRNRGPADNKPAPDETRTKKSRATSGSGQGCAKRMTELLNEGYFKEGKETGEVVAKLRERATPYPANKVSAALIGLAKGKRLRRYGEGGKWLYIVP